MVWTAGRRSRFDLWHRRKDLSSSLCGHTGSGTRPASSFLSPGLKRGRGVKVDTHPNLVQRSRMSRSYTSSPPWRFMAVPGQICFTLLCYISMSLSSRRMSGKNFSASHYLRLHQISDFCLTFIPESVHICFRIKMAALWDVSMCNVVVNRRFRSAYCLHHQGALMMEAVHTSEMSIYFNEINIRTHW
jgi:hypothetical protein